MGRDLDERKGRVDLFMKGIMRNNFVLFYNDNNILSMRREIRERLRNENDVFMVESKIMDVDVDRSII